MGPQCSPTHLQEKPATSDSFSKSSGSRPISCSDDVILSARVVVQGQSHVQMMKRVSCILLFLLVYVMQMINVHQLFVYRMLSQGKFSFACLFAFEGKFLMKFLLLLISFSCRKPKPFFFRQADFRHHTRIRDPNNLCTLAAGFVLLTLCIINPFGTQCNSKTKKLRDYVYVCRLFLYQP